LYDAPEIVSKTMSMEIQTAIEVHAGSQDQDRAYVYRGLAKSILVIADGVGGFGDGAAAANVAISATEDFANDRISSLDELMGTIDAEAAKVGGLTTVVVAQIERGIIRGASVGDSAAWLISATGVFDLTQNQRRKPLAGDGSLHVEFGPLPFTGRLLLATDGLIKYAHYQKIIDTALRGSVASAAEELVRLPMLPAGYLPDDVAVILAELNSNGSGTP
jgi:PPM family protein phosphatase